MIVANPSILKLEGNGSKYYPLRSDDIDRYNHIRERHHEEQIYLCGMKIMYTRVFCNINKKTEDIITCPACKTAYRALNK